MNYRSLDVSDPVAVGIDVTGVSWGSLLVKIGAVFGLGTVMLVMLLGQSRVFYSMSKDGLLWKWASAVHPKFRTPWISNIVVGTIVAFLPALLPIDKLAALVNMGTLLAFTIVCAGVWILRRRHPDLHGPSRRRWSRWFRSSVCAARSTSCSSCRCSPGRYWSSGWSSAWESISLTASNTAKYKR